MYPSTSAALAIKQGSCYRICNRRDNYCDINLHAYFGHFDKLHDLNTRLMYMSSIPMVKVRSCLICCISIVVRIWDSRGWLLRISTTTDLECTNYLLYLHLRSYRRNVDGGEDLRHKCSKVPPTSNIGRVLGSSTKSVSILVHSCPFVLWQCTLLITHVVIEITHWSFRPLIHPCYNFVVRDGVEVAVSF